ncbi:hypothetical protein HK102_012518, partial [Quaeritorhiza haematococci]
LPEAVSEVGAAPEHELEQEKEQSADVETEERKETDTAAVTVTVTTSSTTDTEVATPKSEGGMREWLQSPASGLRGVLLRKKDTLVMIKWGMEGFIELVRI